MVIDAETVEAMVLGGALLGGGGGGSIALGRELAAEALRVGHPRLTSLDELDPEALVATVSMVGAPAAPDRHVTAEHFVEAVRLLQEHLDVPLAGLITSENGGTASVNGLIQAASLGIPFVDAPCNGRAHPTGVMGSMGLGSDPAFISRQAAVGGDERRGFGVRSFVEASLPKADALVRFASVEAGGMVAVARNPVPARYLREHAAPGAITLAIRVGRVIARCQRSGEDGVAVAEALAELLGGRVLAVGEAREVVLQTRGGYDVGWLRLGDLTLTFWNEYMTAERDGKRLATFPELLTTVDAADGTPVATSELAGGRRVVLLHAPRERMILGAGMRDRENYAIAEEALGLSIIDHIFEVR